MRLFLTSAACPRIPGDREASRPYLDEISRSRSASGHYRDSGAARNRSRALSAQHPASREELSRTERGICSPCGFIGQHPLVPCASKTSNAVRSTSPSNGDCLGWLFIRGTRRGPFGA